LNKRALPIAFAIAAIGAVVAITSIGRANVPGTTTFSTLPTGTHITPAGTEVQKSPTGTTFGLLPQTIAVSPSGRWLATSDSGNSSKTVTIVDLQADRVVSNFPIVFQGHTMATFSGLAWSDDNTLWLSGGTYSAVYQLTRQANNTFAIKNLVPTGYFPAQISFDPSSKLLYVANDMSDNVTVIDTSTALPISTSVAGDHPFDVLLAKGRLYVSNWGNSTISAFQVAGPALVPLGASPNPGGYTDIRSIAPTAPTTLGAVATVGNHPTAMLLGSDGRTLFVTNGNDDTVSAVDTTTMTQTAVIHVAPHLTKDTPRSSAPGALALYGKYLFVALGGDNAIAVIDTTSLRQPDKAVLGYVPTGWYPSALQIIGSSLYYTNAKGDGPSGASAGGTGALFQGRGVPPNGTLWHVPLSDILTHLGPYSNQVFENNNWRSLPGLVSAKHTPLEHIKHVIYILRENKTFDEEFSDIASVGVQPVDSQPCTTPGAKPTWDATNQNYKCSDGKSPLLFYGKEITPNNHALAQRYAMLDNFYVDVETSIIGHQFANTSQLSDYAQRTYGNTSQWTNTEPGFFPNNGAFDIATPGGGYLFTEIAKSGHSARAYSGGYDAVDVSARPDNAEQILNDTDMLVPIGLDSGIYPDTLRVLEFQRDVQTRGLADFSFIWLPDDHTVGGLPGNLTPQAQVATNDLATGQLVDFISHSKYWKDTAVFVIEDDPQSGHDHISGYRSIFMLASPWAKRGYVTSAHYDMSSMLHTMELVFGVAPLSHNDLTIAPMTDLFTETPDYTPYTFSMPQVPPTLNPPAGLFASATKKYDLNDVDPEGFDTLVARMQLAGNYGWLPMTGARTMTIAQQWQAFIGAGTKYPFLFGSR